MTPTWPIPCTKANLWSQFSPEQRASIAARGNAGNFDRQELMTILRDVSGLPASLIQAREFSCGELVAMIAASLRLKERGDIQ